MGIWGWAGENAFELISAVGVIGGLLFTAISLRDESKTRRIANLLSITANHRELWKTMLGNAELKRIHDTSADLAKQPVTAAERIFVNLVIQHIHSVYRTMNDHLVVNVQGLRRDVAQFFSLPIPRMVWEQIKVVQNDDFVSFVESCRNWK
jgi:hypothetical protein